MGPPDGGGGWWCRPFFDPSWQSEMSAGMSGVVGTRRARPWAVRRVGAQRSPGCRGLAPANLEDPGGEGGNVLHSQRPRSGRRPAHRGAPSPWCSSRAGTGRGGPAARSSQCPGVGRWPVGRLDAGRPALSCRAEPPSPTRGGGRFGGWRSGGAPDPARREPGGDHLVDQGGEAVVGIGGEGLVDQDARAGSVSRPPRD